MQVTINNIHALPAFEDNYLWLLETNGQAIAIDPGDANVVESALERLNLSLTTILITHHHSDHIGGVKALYKQHHCTIYAPKNSLLKHSLQDLPITEVDAHASPNLASLGLKCTVLELPGHTMDHVAYLIEETIIEKADLTQQASQTQTQQQLAHLFCGDVLFSAGCGRLFEGTHKHMYHSLQQIAQLKPDTLIYPAHEYTLKNIAFAKQCEPENLALIKYEQICIDLRKQSLPTLPTRLDTELAINPFLRCEHIAPALSLLQHTNLAVFTHLRQQKDVFI